MGLGGSGGVGVVNLGLGLGGEGGWVGSGGVGVTEHKQSLCMALGRWEEVKGCFRSRVLFVSVSSQVAVTENRRQSGQALCVGQWAKGWGCRPDDNLWPDNLRTEDPNVT